MIGVNQCTRALEQHNDLHTNDIQDVTPSLPNESESTTATATKTATPFVKDKDDLSQQQHRHHRRCLSPQLVLMAKDVYPPTCLSHIVLMAKRQNVPVLLLSGRATTDLGRCVGVKKASVVLIRSGPSYADHYGQDDTTTNNNNDHDDDADADADKNVKDGSTSVESYDRWNALIDSYVEFGISQFDDEERDGKDRSG